MRLGLVEVFLLMVSLLRFPFLFLLKDGSDDSGNQVAHANKLFFNSNRILLDFMQIPDHVIRINNKFLSLISPKKIKIKIQEYNYTF